MWRKKGEMKNFHDKKGNDLQNVRECLWMGSSSKRERKKKSHSRSID